MIAHYKEQSKGCDKIYQINLVNLKKMNLTHIKDVKLAAGGESLTLEEAELKALKEAYFQERARREYSNIPHVLSVNGTKITMTKIDGVSLIKYLLFGGYRYKDLLITTLVGIINQIHNSGIIHADYGPHNVIINNQTNIAYIIDFGESVIPCRNVDEMKLDDINEMVSSINNIIAYIYLSIKLPPEDMRIIESQVANEIKELRIPENYARIQRYINNYM